MNQIKHCKKHGDYESKHIDCGSFGISIWTGCQECAEEKRAASEADERAREAERIARIWENKMQLSGIPERFNDRTLETYIAATESQQNALDIATLYADHFQTLPAPKNAIFSGKFGTGKTHLACGIALRIMGRYGRHAVFITTQRLIRAVRDTWRRDSDKSESEVVAAFVHPDLLIIDELGVQAGTENERQILFDIINDRYEKRKATLILTNLSVEECKQFLGMRVFDRLRDDGGMVIVFDWESYRGTK